MHVRSARMSGAERGHGLVSTANDRRCIGDDVAGRAVGSPDWSLMPRPRHPDADVEALIRSLERQGWIVEKGRKYYKAKCWPPCVNRCYKTVKLTPSDPNYLRNLRGWFKRSGCWEEE
jgi:hypothetical protein